MYEYNVKDFKSIYDGDTFIAYVDLGFGVTKTEKFRMALINAPELRGDSYEEGKKSRNWLRERVAQAQENGSSIVIRTHKDSKGKYGRYIAELYIDGIYVNQEMIDLGLAVPY